MSRYFTAIKMVSHNFCFFLLSNEFKKCESLISTITIVIRYFTAIKIVSRYFRDKLEKMSFIDFVVCVFPGLRDQVAHGTSQVGGNHEVLNGAVTNKYFSKATQ